MTKLKLVDAMSKGNRDPEVWRAAERLADLQMTIMSIRRAKTSLINRAMDTLPNNAATGGVSELGEEGTFVADSGPNPGGERSTDGDGPSERASLEFSEGKAIANNLKQLATLDTYERRTLSRRRKAAFALLLAFEGTVGKGG
ncbi:hypothetical protein [Neomesorhizobium albiziae]|nr:hypothetical protein [Mesorhizobium albiziae]GLS32814.1 hypothetical protein GCM10007937_45240 [Mesorhizobium albiziae]